MGKTILISGGASGFGRGVAFGLVKLGYDVIIGCQIWPQVTEVRADLAAANLNAKVIKLDVLNEIDVKNATKYDVDILFNNAGIMESGSMVEIPLSVVRSVFETNVFSALNLAQLFARKMIKKGGGRIIWTSSVAGLVKVPFDGAYAASKHAVEGICSAMREELEPYGVQLITVNPGAFKTGFNDTGMETMDQWWDQGERLTKHWTIRELTSQYDPQIMIDEIISIVQDANPHYRNVRPKQVEDMVKEQQSEVWNLKV